MPEWTVQIDSPENTTSDDGVLDAFLSALERDDRALAPAVSIDTDTGVLGSTFTVIADSRDAAALEGCIAYWRALAAAGVETDDLSGVHVSPADDEQDVTDFRAGVNVEHAV